MSQEEIPRVGKDGRFTDTEATNAERLLETHSRYLRYRTDLGWFAYDVQAGRWRRDETLVRRMALETVKAIRYEAAESTDDRDADRLWKWAKKSMAAHGIRNMQELASVDPAIYFEPDELDADPRILNAASNVVHLKDGTIYNQDPKLLLTRQTNARYSMKPMLHPEWTAFIESALPDPEVREYVQKAVGYSITGETSLECLFFIHGPTNAGKSTFVSAIQSALGDYAATVSFDLFIRHSGHERDRAPDFAGLRGRRFVASVEVQKGKRLAEDVIKAITGGDRIRARHLYHEGFEYRPAWKLWLVANDQPHADSVDDAFWRRIIVIPFTHAPLPENRKLGLKDLFASDPTARSAVLWWAVEGARMWYAGGRKLETPDVIREATVEYREVADDLADFYDECLEFDPEWRDTRGDEIYRACKMWCESNGVHVPRQRDLADGLRRRGAENIRTNKARLWLGVRVRV